MKIAINHACIIIDDPILRENYGFLNYRNLLSLMDKHNFFTTIAFIPWNFNRTDKRIAALFRERPDRFSLCVHGCDHTKSEFGSTDFYHLDNVIKLATARMIEHEKITSVPFERVMVFPQGIFSNEALEALKRNNYLAAINTEPLPVNGQYFSDFPFFLRYNPEDISNFVQGPIFVTLHHDYFKKGYDNLTNLVDMLNTQNEKLKWDSVGKIISHYVSTIEVKNDPIDIEPSGMKFHGLKKTVKIGMRRYLSEFRDNYFSKNDTLLNWTKKITSLINPR